MFNRKNQIQDMDAYVEERLSDFLDGTLSDQERKIVEAQLAVSERARASYESLRYTVNLLKQTPAPVLPRQFTLPVSLLAPARTTPAWLVWGLRGVAVAATAAFVILLTTTLVRQNNQNQALEQAAPMAAMAEPSPSAMIALGPTSAPAATTVPEGADDQDNAQLPSAMPMMITIEPPADTPVPEATSAPAAADTNKVQETAIPPAPAPAQDALPPFAPAEAPTESSVAELAQPTATEIRDTTDATAAGSAALENTPVFAPTNSESTTQRSSVVAAIEGVISATRLRIRSGPGIQYPAIGGLTNGDVVKILGRDVSGSWLVIDYPQDLDTGIGWIGALFVEESIEIETLPVYEAPEPIQLETGPTGQAASPTPTATATPTPTRTDTATDVPTLEPTPELVAPSATPGA